MKRHECTLAGCSRTTNRVLYCNSHYSRARKYGSPESGPPIQPIRLKPEEMFTHHLGPMPDTDSCVEWPATRFSTGYGKLYASGASYSTHRISYEIFHGLIPDGYVVRHSCDNPPCVNPRHLLVGTTKQNNGDSVRRDRHQRGMRHTRAKLTDQQVREIRGRWCCGAANQPQLAAKFGVAQTTISQIVRGKSWKHLDRKAA